MKILYAIQGTGNGHLARATEIVPLLKEMGETDILVSGIQADIKLPFTVHHKLYGISFIFGQHGGVDLFKTLYKLKPLRFIRDLLQLKVHNYDVVISDFEPVSAWACLLKGKKAIGLSHQNAVLHHKAPRPNKHDRTGELVLKFYAPTHKNYGFHFKQIDSNNFTPVIRRAIREATPTNNKHYTVYLPAYSNEEIHWALTTFTDIKWEVFSKHNTNTCNVGNITFHPVSIQGFNKSFVNCEGMLCNAGFETPAEALYMGKKLCVIPMKYQYEQACNAQFLNDIGILVLSDLRKEKNKLKAWLSDDCSIQLNYADSTKEILQEILLDQKPKVVRPRFPKIDIRQHLSNNLLQKHGVQIHKI